LFDFEAINCAGAHSRNYGGRLGPPARGTFQRLTG
jgi:hypothetical protein